MKTHVLIIYLITNIHCTIDMNIPEFEYIANHLSPEECRELIASLYFESYELPESLSTARKKVPEDVSCIDLLIKWNSGEEKWEGRGKTHVDVAHRLRQIGQFDLADWLGTTVFNQLIDDIQNCLFNDTYFENIHKMKTKVYVDKKPCYKNEWAMFDTILWLALFGLLATLVFTICRISNIMIKMSSHKRKMDREERRKLLNESLIEENDDVILNMK